MTTKERKIDDILISIGKDWLDIEGPEYAIAFAIYDGEVHMMEWEFVGQENTDTEHGFFSPFPYLREMEGVI